MKFGPKFHFFLNFVICGYGSDDNQDVVCQIRKKKEIEFTRCFFELKVSNNKNLWRSENNY